MFVYIQLTIWFLKQQIYIWNNKILLPLDFAFAAAASDGVGGKRTEDPLMRIPSAACHFAGKKWTPVLLRSTETRSEHSSAKVTKPVSVILEQPTKLSWCVKHMIRKCVQVKSKKYNWEINTHHLKSSILDKHSGISQNFKYINLCLILIF